MSSCQELSECSKRVCGLWLLLGGWADEGQAGRQGGWEGQEERENVNEKEGVESAGLWGLWLQARGRGALCPRLWWTVMALTESGRAEAGAWGRRWGSALRSAGDEN